MPGIHRGKNDHPGISTEIDFVVGGIYERFDSALDKVMRPLPTRNNPIVTQRISID